MAERPVDRMRVGDVEIVALPDGAANLGGRPLAGPGDGGEDEPPVDWAEFHERFPDGFHGPDHHWRIHNNCYLVRSGGRRIVVDLGVGVGPYPRYGGLRGHLPQSMARAGLAPDDVDAVFFTHAHPDHVAWSVNEDAGTPTFPRARYLLHHADWHEYAVHRQPPPRYIERFVAPLRDLGVLDLLDGERALTDEVTAIETPGHTPGHMSLLIASAGEHAVITGDVFPSPFYLSEPERPFGSDLDRARGIASRRALLERIEAEGMRVIGGHFPEPGWGEVIRVHGRRWFRAL